MMVWLVWAAAAWAQTGTLSKPSINAVLNAASYSPVIAGGTWIEVMGSNLSATTRIWGPADFMGTKLPVQLDGVAATVNGIPAFVYYVSPGQLNLLAPDDVSEGLVQVQVTTNAGSSNTFVVTKSTFSPAFFAFTPKYPAAIHVDGSYVGPAGLIAGGTFVPAMPGETIELYGTGFGPANPPAVSAMVVSAPAALGNPVTVTVGGVATQVQYAGIVAGGVVQLNVTLPANLPDGDALIVATVHGVTTQAGLFLTVHK